MEASTTSPWYAGTPDQTRFSRFKSAGAGQKNGTQTSGTNKTDIAVIGGGIAGVITAWRLAELGAHVTLLEKNNLVTGDTGYTTAFVTRVPDTPLAPLVKKYGLDFVRRVFAANTEAQNYIQRLIKENKIDCDWQDCNSYNGSTKKNDKFLHDEWDIAQKVDARSEFVTRDGAPSGATPRGGTATPNIAPFVEAISYDHEGRFDPRKFLFGLLQTSIGRHITIHEQTEVTAIIPAASAGREITIVTAGGSLTCRKVVIATGLPHHSFAELHPLLRPQITYAIAAKYATSAPISDDIFWDTDEPYYQYFRRLGSDTIILGGADRPASAAGKSVQDDPRKKLETYLTKFAPGNFTTTNAWSGSLFYSPDGLPLIGEHPHHRGKVFIATGFGGNGMVMGTVAGLLLADLVLGRTNAYVPQFSLTRGNIRVPKKAPVALTAPASPSSPALKFWRIFLPLVYIAVLVLPGYIFFSLRGGLSFLEGTTLQQGQLLIFPLFGLYAFTLVWAQLMLGTSMDLLRRVFPWVEGFHRKQGVFVLLLALTHPTLLLLAYGPAEYLAHSFVAPEQALFVYLGQFQLFLIVLTVSAGLLRKWRPIRRSWRYIHWANYLVFISAWIHSWFLGTDVQPTALRYLWIFFGITAIVSTIARVVRGTKRKRMIAGTSMGSTGTGKSAGAFTQVATLGQVTEGKPLCITANGQKIALFKVDGTYKALSNTCAHQGGPLCEGPQTGGVIECPWHGSRYEIATGKVVRGPATAGVRAYEVRVRGNNIEVKV